MKKSDPRIEIVSRAICNGHGFDPDQDGLLERGHPNPKRGPRWLQYQARAIDHIAAYDALRSIEADKTDGNRDG